MIAPKKKTVKKPAPAPKPTPEPKVKGKSVKVKDIAGVNIEADKIVVHVDGVNTEYSPKKKVTITIS